MKYEITKEQILEAHKAACSEWKKKIESWFPDVFKSKLEVGKWYKDTANGMFTFCFSGEYSVTTIGSKNYGFNALGSWRDGLAIHDDIEYKPCTEPEVYEMLINEAKKRGYKAGNFKCLDKWDKNPSHYWEKDQNPIYALQKGKLWIDNIGQFAYCIFDNGKWAEIVEQPKEYTLKELEQKLGEKIKIVG